MYSILIKGSSNTYSYATNADGNAFAGDAEATKAKVKELLDSYPLGKIAVVHNVTLTADLALEDVI
jgi:hypothetical protein